VDDVRDAIKMIPSYYNDTENKQDVKKYIDINYTPSEQRRLKPETRKYYFKTNEHFDTVQKTLLEKYNRKLEEVTYYFFAILYLIIHNIK